MDKGHAIIVRKKEHLAIGMTCLVVADEDTFALIGAFTHFTIEEFSMTLWALKGAFGLQGVLFGAIFAVEDDLTGRVLFLVKASRVGLTSFGRDTAFEHIAAFFTLQQIGCAFPVIAVAAFLATDPIVLIGVTLTGPSFHRLLALRTKILHDCSP